MFMEYPTKVDAPKQSKTGKNQPITYIVKFFCQEEIVQNVLKKSYYFDYSDVLLNNSCQYTIFCLSYNNLCT